MDKELKRELQEEISGQIESLDNLDMGSDEHSKAVGDLAKLMTQLNEAQKIENDRDLKADDIEVKLTQLDFEKEKLEVEKGRLETENARLEEELKNNKIQSWVKTGVEALGIILPIGFYGIWMKKGLQFEKEGSFTSTTFRGLISKFKPTKK